MLTEKHIDLGFFKLPDQAGVGHDIEVCFAHANAYHAGAYLLAPVAKVVEVEIPGEINPVEPYVGLIYQNDANGYVGEIKALIEHCGKTFVVIHSSSDGFEVVDRDDMVNYWWNWPTTTTPPKREKRLVMLNGWTRNGFGEDVGSESGGTTDER